MSSGGSGGCSSEHGEGTRRCGIGLADIRSSGSNGGGG
jgi:hypothetical protein